MQEHGEVIHAIAGLLRDDQDAYICAPRIRGVKSSLRAYGTSTACMDAIPRRRLRRRLHSSCLRCSLPLLKHHKDKQRISYMICFIWICQ